MKWRGASDSVRHAPRAIAVAVDHVDYSVILTKLLPRYYYVILSKS